ncbi:relaxase domain-containing protein [Dechloromonas sp. TW-R-39-2]|uniref:MobF family relaxase n=1 Tax=Dechloromonas sp. TW-R-39-2 TaxID=2654218 RepID=UPI00193DA082|nr:MobF family relaxase [Dechloromonas sp. TW-R-39-2]QRM19934.1 relaxase domain-containing protein [Dechloromonas sp. TW-R-39-2]
MIRCTNVAARQAESYYSRDDYYTQDNPPASWYGKGAAALGLSEDNADRLFGDLLRGKLPNGEEIPGGQGGKHRAGTDLTISAPKSVSIAALVYADARVTEAHNAAVRAALDAAEKRIQARMVGPDGKTITVDTGNLIARTVLHDTSRAADPNLHTHCVLINATQTPDGRWRAMENRELFKMQRELDVHYKSELAVRLAELGYQLRHNKSGFELATVSDNQIKSFSTRTAAIDAALAARGLSREEASAELRDKTALDTRDRKVHYDRDLLVAAWRERAAELGLAVSLPAGQLPGLARDSKEAAQEAIKFAIGHLSEREAAFEQKDSMAAAMSVAYGRATLAEVEAAFNKALAWGDLVQKSDGRITDRASIAREQRMLEVELLGRGAVRAIASGTLSLDPKLNERQRAAVEAALTTTNRITGIQGLAGVGKTTLLNEFRQQAEACGYTLAGVAPSHGAVKALAEAGIEGKTLQSWEVSGSKLDDRTILVIDESSLASTRQLAEAVIRAEKAGARVLVVGDSDQYQSVEAGRGFQQLQQAGMQTSIVDTMLRQQTDITREVAQLAAEGKGAAALEALAKAGGVVEIKDEAQRLAAIAADFCALPAEERRETLVLTGTNEARRQINAAVREGLSLAGQGKTVETFERGDLTANQQRRAQFYAEGDAVRFDKDYRSLGVKSGDILKVKAIRTNEIELARPDGSTVTFTPANLSGKGWTVGRTDRRELSAGDRIRVTGDIAATGERLRNGQRATVLAISDKQMQVQLDGGKKVAINLENGKPLSLDYGYAATGHSAQGLGAKRVLLERSSACRTASQREFYTDVTRVKQELKVYTDDRAKLGKAVQKQTDKHQALEQSNDGGDLGNSFSEKAMETSEQAHELVDKMRDLADKSRDISRLARDFMQFGL